MSVVKVKEVVIGESKPKICVPIVAKDFTSIIKQAKLIKETATDIVEWRVDWFNDVMNINKVIEVLKELVLVLDGVPLLFTLRSEEEGGRLKIAESDYINLNFEVAKTGLVDLIDIEVFTVEEVESVISKIQSLDVKVVGSSHEFGFTPSKDDMLDTLKYMQSVNADIVKLAVMPKDKFDVLELLNATLIMKEEYADRPMITISMGEYGKITRLVGEMFGSDVTFGAVGDGSAPGQIGVEELKNVHNVLHNNIAEKS